VKDQLLYDADAHVTSCRRRQWIYISRHPLIRHAETRCLLSTFIVNSQAIYMYS